MPQFAQFFFCSHTVFPSSLLVLCLSKHDWLLNVLLQDSHGIRTCVYTHGGMDMQSLHVSWLVCDTWTTSLVTVFTHVTFNHDSCQICDHVIMTIYVIIKQVDSLFRMYLAHRILYPYNLGLHKLQILYSEKWSWNLWSSWIPPPCCISIPVVCDKCSTFWRILFPFRYDL